MYASPTGLLVPCAPEAELHLAHLVGELSHAAPDPGLPGVPGHLGPRTKD